jgi:hypothetical protein
MCLCAPLNGNGAAGGVAAVHSAAHVVGVQPVICVHGTANNVTIKGYVFG